MNNKSYELVVSNNMKYMAGICWKNKINNMHEMKVWYINENQIKEVFELFVCYDLGGERFAISNDGKYIATAQYEDYEGGNLHIYETESGKDIIENISLRQIQWIEFDDMHTLMVGTEAKEILFYDIFSGEFISKIKGKKILRKNILLLNDKKVMYMEKNYKASTFAYLAVDKTPVGLLLAEANGNLEYYNNDGKLYWKTDCLHLGHFVNVHYNINQNIVVGVLFNSRKKKNERMNFVALDHNTGRIIYKYPIDCASYVFIDYSEAVMLVNGKGKIYTFINNQLAEDHY